MKGDGETPHEGRVAIVGRIVGAATKKCCQLMKIVIRGGQRIHSLFEPVCNHDTEDVESKFNGDELTTRRMLGSLGGPYRYDGVEDTGTPSVDQTSLDKSAKLTTA